MTSESIHGFLRFWARRWPDKEAVCFENARVTYGALDDASDKVAAGLAERGVRAGENVGVLMTNRPEFVEIMFGILKAGGVITLLNIRQTAKELVHPVLDSGMRFIFTEEKFLPVLARIRQQAMLNVFTADESGEPSIATFKQTDSRSHPTTVVAADAPAFLCYTSGTTGVPKGALLSHRSIHSAAMARATAFGATHADRVLMPLPLSYTGGAVTLLRDGLLIGATVFLRDTSEAKDFLDLIEMEHITNMASVPVIFERMMSHPDFASTDLTSLRIAIGAGSVISVQLLETWQKRGVNMMQGYGLTESAGSYVTILFGEDAVRKLGSAGRALPNVELSLRNESGAPVEAGTPGEIWIRSPVAMLGYFNMPERSAETTVEGWMRTGDVGVLDPEGFLYIVDRSKDMLISGGLNVYPAEIERVLAGAGGLEEFAIIGVPDAQWGEAAVLVTPDLDRVDLVAFRRICEEELADFKRPKYLVRHNGPLPRTISGKVQKTVLRDTYAKPPADAIPFKSIVKPAQ